VSRVLTHCTVQILVVLAEDPAVFLHLPIVPLRLHDFMFQEGSYCRILHGALDQTEEPTPHELRSSLPIRNDLYILYMCPFLLVLQTVLFTCNAVYFHLLLLPWSILRFTVLSCLSSSISWQVGLEERLGALLSMVEPGSFPCGAYVLQLARLAPFLIRSASYQNI